MFYRTSQRQKEKFLSRDVELGKPYNFSRFFKIIIDNYINNRDIIK